MVSADGNYFDGRPEPPPSGQRRPRISIVPPGPLVLRAANLPDPKEIAPRPWLYGTHLVRGFVTVLVAPGGTGKSAYAMAVAASISSGQEFLGQHIFLSGPTAVLNLEDPIEELDRRLAAIALRHNLERYQLEERIYLHSGEDRPITIAGLDDSGFNVVYPDEETIITQINERGILLLVVDPYAESHTLEENSNPDMVKAAAAWRRIARATGCAVMLVHHVRKGAVTDIEAARGAKALTDSARVGLILSAMSSEEAETFNIPDGERWAYVRLDDAKMNMAPRATEARWFKLEQVELGNGNEDYPSGDRVASIALWKPPAVTAPASNDQVHQILDTLSEPPAGWLYGPHRRGRDHTRWAGTVVMDVLLCSEKQAMSWINAWLKSGLLVPEEVLRRRPAQGADRRPRRRNQEANMINFPEGFSIVWGGQTYCPVGTRQHGESTLLDWQTTCPECGRTFVVSTTLSFHSPRRRCDDCKRPGQHVTRKFGASMAQVWSSVGRLVARLAPYSGLTGQGVWRSRARRATKDGVLSWEFGASLAQVWRGGLAALLALAVIAQPLPAAAQHYHGAYGGGGWHGGGYGWHGGYGHYHGGYGAWPWIGLGALGLGALGALAYPYAYAPPPAYAYPPPYYPPQGQPGEYQAPAYYPPYGVPRY